MAAFEVRSQQLGETEEEFMLSLVRLYKAANPTINGIQYEAAIKRKYLQGISPDLRRNIFVFCNNPYDETVTREKLLEHSRNAKVHLGPSITDIKDSTTVKVLTAAEPVNKTSSDIMDAINDLSIQFNQHMSQTTTKFKEQEENLAVLSQQFDRRDGSFNNNFNNNRGRNRGNYKGRRNYNSRGNNNGDERYSSSIWPTTKQIEEIKCFKCGGINHLARHYLTRDSGNY